MFWKITTTKNIQKSNQCEEILINNKTLMSSFSQKKQKSKRDYYLNNIHRHKNKRKKEINNIY